MIKERGYQIDAPPQEKNLGYPMNQGTQRLKSSKLPTHMFTVFQMTMLDISKFTYKNTKGQHTESIKKKKEMKELLHTLAGKSYAHYNETE